MGASEFRKAGIETDGGPRVRSPGLLGDRGLL